MAYYIGDLPAEDIVIEPARGDGEPIDLPPFDEAETEVTLRDFAGDIVVALFIPTFEGDAPAVVMLEWPATSPFEAAGLYTLAVTLVGTGGSPRERLAPVYFVVQDDTTGWHTIDSARDEWTVGEATVDDRRLWQLLELAREQVLAFAPALADDDPIPARYRAGQLMQAQNLYNAGAVDPNTGVEGSGDTFALRPYPLDWMVKQVLRPARGVPVVA
jgi:hypothetical protein